MDLGHAPTTPYNSSSDASVQVVQGSTSSLKILEQTSIAVTDNAKNYLVFFELVDMDSDMKTTPDDNHTAVMAIVDDINDNIIYEPTLILANDNLRDMNIQAGSNQKTGDVELFLISEATSRVLIFGSWLMREVKELVQKMTGAGTQKLYS